jgi:Ca2+-binding EF-hand superfamily protein
MAHWPSSQVTKIIGRIMRLLQIGNMNNDMELIFGTFIYALPSLFYVALLLLLTFFIWAILGMNLLGRTALQGCLNEDQHFQDTSTAMLTLFGAATGDGITCLIHACTIDESSGLCSEAAGDCGHPFWARIFFISLSITIMFTTLEMFVNIIMSKFDQLSKLAGMPVTHADMHAVVERWKKFDNHATGMMPLDQLPELLEGLPREIGYNDLADEEAIDPKEMRLPLLLDGSFSGFLVTEVEMTPEVAEKERLIKVFRTMDEDHDRLINVDEIMHLADNHDLKLTAEELNLGMCELDPKRAGRVDFQHFYRCTIREASAYRMAIQDTLYVFIALYLWCAALRRWYTTKHAEEGEHSKILTMIEEEEEVLKRQQVNFYEFLYGLAERKCGQAMPATNQLCKEVRRQLGRKMPQVSKQIEADDEREAEQTAEARAALYESFGAMGRVRNNWDSKVLHQGILRKLNTENNAWAPIRFQLTEAELRWGTGSTDKAFTISRALALETLIKVGLPKKHSTTVGPRRTQFSARICAPS